MDAARHPWGWAGLEFDDSQWAAAAAIAPAAGREARDVHTRWMLVPRTIPMMEEKAERPMMMSGTPWAGKSTTAAQAKAALLLDQTYLTTAYPEITVSGGKGAVIRLRYAEALFNKAREKGNRNEVEGKDFIGNYDEFTLDGGAHRVFRPLWWRTYRYLRIEIETKDEAVTIDGLRGTNVGYPFVRRARFDAGVPELNQILDVGWHTARLCAHETYMDCPYYEQLQYAGDTRIQCLVSLFAERRCATDAECDRPAERFAAERWVHNEPVPDAPGAVYSGVRAVVGRDVVHDYFWYVDDGAVRETHAAGSAERARLFRGDCQKEDGSLGSLPWWRYFDWVPSWPNGDAPQEADGGAALFDLQLLMAYRWAAALERAHGIGELAAVYAERERQLRDTVRALYWDDGRKLFADTPAKQKFSQHTNTLAVLADVVEGSDARELMLRILTAPGLAHGELYFKFYIHQALAKRWARAICTWINWTTGRGDAENRFDDIRGGGGPPGASVAVGLPRVEREPGCGDAADGAGRGVGSAGVLAGDRAAAPRQAALCGGQRADASGVGGREGGS